MTSLPVTSLPDTLVEIGNVTPGYSELTSGDTIFSCDIKVAGNQIVHSRFFFFFLFKESPLFYHRFVTLQEKYSKK